jgi:uncharacterized protein YdhG (YjbR/CyaY superfamily)
MRSTATTVPAYLDELPADRREAIETVRGLIRAAVPEAVEDMQYGMPCYSMGPLLFSLASQKGYMALYVTDATVVDAHRDRLGKLNCGKGCIRFKKLADLPLDAINDILTESTARRRAGKTGADGKACDERPSCK